MVEADVDFARQITWFLEWPECRQQQACLSTRRIGPLTLRENRIMQLPLVLIDDRPWWIIIRAELEPEVVADTLEVVWE